MNEPNGFLRVESLSKVFDSKTGEKPVIAVQNFTFEAEEGEFIVLLGPSGCGKTTLLRICAGLDSPTSGKVILDGKPVTRPGRDRGLVFQQYTSFPWLNVIDNVKFGLKYRPDVKRHEWDDVARDFIRLVGLEGFEESYVPQLSGGMQQRLAIARTLAADPKVLLMDEPFGALDTQNREFLQIQLLEAQRVARKIIVFITHDVEEAIFLADRLLILTARPARLKTEINIDLPKPRTLEMKTGDKFLALKREVLDYTREEAAKTDSLWRRPADEEVEPLRNERKFSLRRHKS